MKKVLLPAAIVIAGVLVLAAFVATKPHPKRRPPVVAVPMVDVLNVDLGPHAARVSSQGVLVPAQEVSLQTEVVGRVVWLHKNLRPGGRIDRGDVLFRIDPRDYEYQVASHRAAVDRARVELELERGRGLVAAEEWALLGGGEAAPITLRKPQLQAAEVALRSAESILQQAELALARTSVRAPFNGFVVEESVDSGRLLRPGEAVGRFVGSDAFWLRAAVVPEALGLLSVGTEVEVGSRRGTLIEILGHLDPLARQVQVLVEVRDPQSEPPLYLGALVGVSFTAAMLPRVAEVPRAALHEGSAYVATADNTLAVRPLRIAWRDRETLLIDGGLDQGDRLIVSALASPLPGMALQVRP
jgi:RND family efflux transporter MFP subunit